MALDLEIDEALYAGASSTLRTRQYSDDGHTVPSDAHVSKFRAQVIRFLEALPEDQTVLEILEEMR